MKRASPNPNRNRTHARNTPGSLIKYGGVLAISNLVGRLPFSLIYTLADAIGDVIYWGWRQGRQNTLANMRHVLGRNAEAGEVRRVTRYSFRNYVRLMADFAYCLKSPADPLIERVRVADWSPLEEAIGRGTGTIMVGPHMGNWDLAGMVLSANGYIVNAVMESFASPQVDRLVRSTRETWGIRCIPLRSAMRPLYKALRRNEIVALVADRPAGAHGIPVQFFGYPSSWPAGPATLALRTGAQIVPGYLVRQPDGTFVGRFLSLPHLEFTDERRQNVGLLTQAIVTTLEEPIRRYPEQWFMFRKMWEDGAAPPEA